MKKFDFLWAAALAAVVAFLVVPSTHALFMAASKFHPYLMAFVKFGVLATMGELLAVRIVSGDWRKPVGLIWRSAVWGFIGILIALVFVIYDAGVTGAMAKHYLPVLGKEGFAHDLLKAFMTSALMNTLFAPTFMAFHRITDTYIEMGEGKLSKIMGLRMDTVLSRIEWNSFVTFVICKTVPIFWIPAHTITFMLPPEYRVMMAAMLSIALGGILAFAKRKAVVKAS